MDWNKQIQFVDRGDKRIWGCAVQQGGDGCIAALEIGVCNKHASRKVEG